MSTSFGKKLMELIKYRRSVRVFTGKKIPREDIFSIIEAATWAPTGCNNQELRFLILDNEDEIKEFLDFKPFFEGVSTVILVFADMSLKSSQDMYYKRRYETHLPYVDTGLALANMALCAKSIGVDSCIFNVSKHHFKWHNARTDIVRRIIHKIKRTFGLYASMQDSFEFYLRDRLRVPKCFEPMCSVALGYAKEYPDVRTESHGGRKLMREEVDFYVLRREDFR